MPFAAIFIPNFTFQAIVRCEPELRMQPVAVIEGQPPTYYVVAINRLAEKLGVAVGMTKANVEQFQYVQIRPRNHTQEDTAHQAFLDAACWISPGSRGFLERWKKLRTASLRALRNWEWTRT